MAKLEQMSLEDLQRALEKVDGKKATQRLMLAILYKQGPSVPMIAEWFDLRPALIYRWFDEMESKPLMEAIHDAPRPGRPSKLSEAARAALEDALARSPKEAGYEHDAWTAKLVQQYVKEEFDVEYTLRHVRRLMRASGVAS